jgi:hypothetical protein
MAWSTSEPHLLEKTPDEYSCQGSAAAGEGAKEGERERGRLNK